MSQAFAGLFHHPRTSSAAFSAVIRMSASTAGTAKLSDESGVEVFYDLAITPAVRLIPSYQHIWNPFSAQVVTDQDHADIFLTRLTTAW